MRGKQRTMWGNSRERACGRGQWRRSLRTGAGEAANVNQRDKSSAPNLQQSYTKHICCRGLLLISSWVSRLLWCFCGGHVNLRRPKHNRSKQAVKKARHHDYHHHHHHYSYLIIVIFITRLLPPQATSHTAHVTGNATVSDRRFSQLVFYMHGANYPMKGLSTVIVKIMPRTHPAEEEEEEDERDGINIRSCRSRSSFLLSSCNISLQCCVVKFICCLRPGGRDFLNIFHGLRQTRAFC